MELSPFDFFFQAPERLVTLFTRRHGQAHGHRSHRRRPFKAADEEEGPHDRQGTSHNLTPFYGTRWMKMSTFVHLCMRGRERMCVCVRALLCTDISMGTGTSYACERLPILVRFCLAATCKL